MGPLPRSSWRSVCRASIGILLLCSRDPESADVDAEDPYLTGEYGSYIVRGTQQNPMDGRYLSAAVTMKHFQL